MDLDLDQWKALWFFWRIVICHNKNRNLVDKLLHSKFFAGQFQVLGAQFGH